jgi:ABC-type lipoprotein release transport system permease subunit
MKAVGGMLFGLPPIDPVSLGAAALALSLTGTAASVAPAWRAARLDPVRALRVE